MDRWVLGECGGEGENLAVVCGVQQSGVAWPCPQRRACSALASACMFGIGLGGISGVSVIERGDGIDGASRRWPSTGGEHSRSNHADIGIGIVWSLWCSNQVGVCFLYAKKNLKQVFCSRLGKIRKFVIEKFTKFKTDTKNQGTQKSKGWWGSFDRAMRFGHGLFGGWGARMEVGLSG